MQRRAGFVLGLMGQRHAKYVRQSKRRARPVKGAATHVLHDQAYPTSVGRLIAGDLQKEKSLSELHSIKDARERRLSWGCVEPRLERRNLSGYDGPHRVAAGSTRDTFQASPQVCQRRRRRTTSQRTSSSE